MEQGSQTGRRLSALVTGDGFCCTTIKTTELQTKMEESYKCLLCRCMIHPEHPRNDVRREKRAVIYDLRRAHASWAHVSGSVARLLTSVVAAVCFVSSWTALSFIMAVGGVDPIFGTTSIFWCQNFGHTPNPQASTTSTQLPPRGSSLEGHSPKKAGKGSL